jgi:transposase
LISAVLPARPRRPRDKAKVEAAVLIIELWLLGKLRHRRFYSLAELNAAIGELLCQLNEERPIRRLGATRRALLEELDRPHLKALPSEPYAFAEWRLRRVGVDYHVEVEAHFYSRPSGSSKPKRQRNGGARPPRHDSGPTSCLLSPEAA